MTKLWKPIIGYESLYEISNSGDIRRRRGFWCHSDRPVKLAPTNSGYLRVRLCNRQRPYIRYSVHRLVFENFIGPIPEDMTVNHLNGCKTDNRPENLELASMSEQMTHAYRTGLQARAVGEARKNVAKLTTAQAKAIKRRYRKGTVTAKMLAAEYGVSRGCAYAVATGRRWSHLS